MTEGEKIYTQADVDAMLERRVPTGIGLFKKIDENNRVFFRPYAMIGYRHIAINVGITIASEEGTVIIRDISTAEVMAYFPNGAPDLPDEELKRLFGDFLCQNVPKDLKTGTKRVMHARRTKAQKALKDGGYDIIYMHHPGDMIKFIVSKNGIEKGSRIITVRHSKKWGILK